MQNQTSNVEGQYKTLTLVWFALLVSQLMFAVVVFFAKPEIFKFDWSKPLLGDNAMITAIFALLAISNLAMSLVISRKYINQAIAEQKPALVQTAVIVGCALCEAISLFGVVLAFAFSYQYFFLWIGLGIVGIILHFPKRENLIAASYKR
jgi:F0F1-type ATP synthase membrane subunit c/vacuolar-type H+-ATPase subunit K